MVINVINGILSEEEKLSYVRYAIKNSNGKEIESLDIKMDGDFVDLTYHFKKIPFQRIRRITGYLVGSIERFNNGKRAEVESRTKHSL